MAARCGGGGADDGETESTPIRESWQPTGFHGLGLADHRSPEPERMLAERAAGT
ncbi:hypothetical protein [Streptomyces sp. NPDC047061]|uniref:hypothetical protein n=1 Tax=Streptomyces sp. NPDC047061 TaxID=3154605 RepID=UPI0033EA051E